MRMARIRFGVMAASLLAIAGLSLFFCEAKAVAQDGSSGKSVWAHFHELNAKASVQRVELPEAQHAALVALIGSRIKQDTEGCEGEEEQSALLAGLMTSAIIAAPGQTFILVEAGGGCARGAQGANGSMWLLRFEGSKPVLLASPSEHFEGWLYSVQKTASHGYPDIILGWHMGAAEQILSYFQFDGRRYNAVSGATLDSGEDGKETLTPHPLPGKAQP
jgi:hypothetical protein